MLDIYLLVLFLYLFVCVEISRRDKCGVDVKLHLIYLLFMYATNIQHKGLHMCIKMTYIGIKYYWNFFLWTYGRRSNYNENMHFYILSII